MAWSDFRVLRLLISVAFVGCAFWLLATDEPMKPALGAVVFGAATIAFWLPEMRARADDWANEQTEKRRQARVQVQQLNQLPYQQSHMPPDSPQITLPPSPNQTPDTTHHTEF